MCEIIKKSQWYYVIILICEYYSMGVSQWSAIFITASYNDSDISHVTKQKLARHYDSAMMSLLHLWQNGHSHVTMTVMLPWPFLLWRKRYGLHTSLVCSVHRTDVRCNTSNRGILRRVRTLVHLAKIHSLSPILRRSWSG